MSEVVCLERLACLENIVFVSPPLRRTYDEIRLPTYLNEKGCWIGASSQAGKTKALEYCEAALKMELPNAVVLRLNMHILPAATKRSFPIRLLQRLGIEQSSIDTTKLRIKLAKTIGDRLANAAQKLCILLLDESQAMTISDFYFLKDLSNDLLPWGVSLLTFVFGETPKMSNIVDQLQNGDEQGLAERFVRRELRLHTYDSTSDFHDLLQQMDEIRFEVFGSMSVTQYFLGSAFHRGFRFATEAARVFEAQRNAMERGADVNLGRIFIALRWILARGGECEIFDRSGAALSEGVLQNAIGYALCVPVQSNADDTDVTPR